jgi:hypothetical protein
MAKGWEHMPIGAIVAPVLQRCKANVGGRKFVFGTLSSDRGGLATVLTDRGQIVQVKSTEVSY